MFRALENSKWFSTVLLLGALVLLAVAVLNLGGQLNYRPELKRRATSPNATVLVGKIEALFSPATLAACRPATNSVNPFYTTYFQPPPTPPKPATPTPAPSPTKKILLTYQGVYQTAGGEKKAFVKVGDTLFVGPVGSNVVADLAVVDIALRTLTLKNAASQTNLLQFNVPKEVEVPNK
ncbi:MAG: hypothetical protein HY298_12595 [Verrucomicrobia bacterium]|nr:hypothetical protein [Verrucomicrobiota bacterium]